MGTDVPAAAATDRPPGFYLDGPGAYPSLAWAEAFPAIRRHGFGSVDLSAHRGVAHDTSVRGFTPAVRRSLRELLDDSGLAVGALVTHAGLAETALAPADTGPVLDLAAVVDLAGELGAEAVTVHIGSVPPDQRERRREQCAQVFQAACDVARSGGVDVLVDALVPGSLVETPEEFVALATAVDRPNFGWNADPGFLLAAGRDVGQVLTQLVPWTRHAHLKDVAGRWPEVRWKVPGDGGLDWAGVRQALGRTHVSVEVISGPAHAAADFEYALSRSASVLRAGGWSLSPSRI